jgi:hypothetical protein
VRTLCRPFGTRVDCPLYPGLTPWANTFRPNGAAALTLSASLLFLEAVFTATQKTTSASVKGPAGAEPSKADS